jgi:hypothetical protein
VIYNTSKLVAVVALALAVGCGTEADMMAMQGGPAIDALGTGGAPGTGGSAGAVDALGMPDALPSMGGAGGAVTGSGGATGGTPGTGGSVGATGGTSGASGGASGAGGAPAVEYKYCPQYPEFSRSKPGFLNKDLTWTSRYKDGYACAICTHGKTAPKQVVGCLIKYSVELDGPDPLLCVQSQAECCFKVTTTCERDSDCCVPLHCMDNGPGKSKTCR